MPSLLDRLKKNIAGAAKGAVNTASRVYDTGNILDGGLSWNTRTVDPKKQQSVVQQATNQVVKPIIKPVVQVANTGKALVGGTIGLGRVGAASVLGSDRDYTNELKGVTNTLNRDLSGNTGLLGMGTVFKNAQEAQDITPRQLAGKSIAYGSQIASLATPQFKGLSVAGKAIPNLVARPASNALIGAAGSAGGQYAETGKIDPKAIGRDAAISAVLGEAPGAAKAISKQAAPALKKGAQTAVKANEKAFTPRVSVQDQNVLRDFSDLQAGTYSPSPDARGSLIAQARQVGAKYGVDLNSGNPRDLLDKTNSVLDQVGQRNKAMAQGGYVGNVPGDENLESIVQNSNTRPAAEIQTAIERAHNAGDNEAVAQLITQLPEDMQPSMRGVFNLPEPKGKQRGFVQSVKENADISRETKRATNGTYNVRNTNQLAQSADNYATGDIESITKDVQNRLNVKTGNITDKDVADSITTAEKLDIAGDSERASQIYESLAEHLTKQGQSIQAASLLSRRTPEGLKYSGEKAIKKAGGKISPDLRKQMDAALAEVRSAPIGSEARTYATQKYQTLVGRTLPTSATDKATAIWKAGLLTGIRTQTGGTLSNATFGALRTASDPLASAIDRAISVVTGTRTKTATLRGNAQGFKEGVVKGKAVLKTGIDERADIGNKFDQREVNFGEGVLGKAANTYVNGVFRLMGAQDRPWYYRQLRQSLNDLALADGKNKRLRGADLNKYVDNFTKEPPKGALQVASNEAEKSVLGNDTFLSNVAGGIRRAAGNLENPLARNTASAAVNVLMPFTKVPSAFISRVIDYTPVGALKEVGQQIAAKQFDQRALATALSEATTGSAIIYLGAELANVGLLSGTYPTDPKEAARWKAEGIQPNSIKVGNTWLSLNYFGPLGSLFNQGKRVTDSLSEGQGVGGAASNAVGGIATDALNQSFLQGVSGAVDAVQDPKRYAQNFVRNQAGSVVPTLLGDVATATDTSQRQVNSPGEAIKNRLPGLRQTLMPAQDVYGNKLDAKTNPLTGAVNPFRPSDINKSPVLSEVARLHDTDPTNTDMNVTPTAITKKVDINGVQTQLNDKQRYDLQERVGKATQTAWDKLIKTPEYQSLTDPEKADALRTLRTDAAAVAKQQFAAKNNLGQYAADFTGKDKLLTKAQQRLNTNNPDVNSYAKTTSSTSASRSSLGDDVPDNTPDYAKQWISKYKDLDSKQLDDIKYKEPGAEFEYEAAKFEKDLASGKVKKADEIKTRSKLQKLEAGKDTPKEIRDLYSLNKTQVYQLITTDPDGNTIAQMLLDYGDKLEGATGTKNKFKTKYGDVDFDPATASTSGTKKSSGGKKSGSSKTFQVPGNANPFGSILSSSNSVASAARNVSIKAKKPTKRRKVS